MPQRLPKNLSAGQPRKARPMKKIISVQDGSTGKAVQRKSQAEMEYEMEHCPAPWNCPKAYYSACLGCFQKTQRGGKK